MDLLPGDIAACYGSDAVSRSIQLLTAWPFAPAGLRLPPSHVALIAPCLPEHVDDRLGWWESTTLSHHPCRITGRQHAGLQLHHPADRLREYQAAGGRVVIYRLVDGWELSAGDEAFLEKCLYRWAARPYDVRGAMLSGTRLWQLLKVFPAADLASLFCSELIADRLMRLNRLNHDNPTRFHPGRLLRRLVAQGKYVRSHALVGDGSWLMAISQQPSDVLPLRRAA